MKGFCVGLFITVICGPFLLIGILFAWKTISLRIWGIRTEATVVDSEQNDGDDGSYPIVEFVDQEGATHRVTLPVGGGEQCGSTITVLYNAGYPDDAMGTSIVQAWMPLLLLFMGGGGVWIGIRILFGVIPLN